MDTPTAQNPSPPPTGTDAGGAPRGLVLGITARTGLQGKLVLCFVFLLAACLGASCWLFVSESRATFDRVSAEQARQLSKVLATAAETKMSKGDAAGLQQLGAELMKTKGLVGVAFFDAAGRPLAIASHDPDVERPGAMFFGNPRAQVGDLSEPRDAWTPTLGPYVQLTVPVSRLAAVAAPRPSDPAPPPAGEVVGFVTVCVSQADIDSRVSNVALSAVLIGAVGILVCWPAMYGVVHRVIAPIRQLVAAADRIAAGDLDARVDIDRPDVIGTLARSFNAMVSRVRGQQSDLEQANGQLAEANGLLGEANERLAAANRDLERKVADRTAELERTNRRLNAEMTEKDEFLRTVSHDLNAPLRNIAGMAAVLLMKYRETFDPDVVHRLERIQKNVELETDLIGELLELSRIKSRRQRMEPTDLGEVAREVGEVFAQDFEGRGVRFVVDTPMPTLVCERARFRQVFQNLVDNAVKYMGDGSEPAALAAAGLPAGEPDAAGRVRAIHVGCRDADDPSLVELYVRDTGMGIDPADVEHVFRVFRRGKSQAVQQVAGKGVGLASVKSIVETYGGAVRVESRVGIGSTFRLTVDRKHLADAAQVKAAA